MNIALHKTLTSIQGAITLPGSKSISNRVLMIKALSGLDFNIENLSNSDDTHLLQEALHSYPHNSVINIGHAGTDMRFLTAFLALKATSIQLTGSERMQQRPIKPLVNALQLLGADISYTNSEGFPPLLIKGRDIKGGYISVQSDISSQFISALLLVAPYFENGLQLELKGNIVSKPYINMTIEIMKQFGAQVTWQDHLIKVEAKAYSYPHKTYTIESDWSAASYYYSIVALSKIGTQLTLRYLSKNSLQADAASDSLFLRFGVTTKYLNNYEIVLEKTADQHTAYFQYDFTDAPDIAQTIVCTCIALNIPFKINGLQTLNIKETNRIDALRNEWLKADIQLDTTLNSMEFNKHISPIQFVANLKTYNDHRMAMSFAPLALITNLVIEHADVVSKSYPQFWEHLHYIGIKHQTI